MVFSRWRSIAEFKASNAFRKDISYRIILSPTFSLVSKTFADAVRCIYSMTDKFGNSPEADVRLCFNGAPVRGYITHFAYGENKWKSYGLSSRS